MAVAIILLAACSETPDTEPVEGAKPPVPVTTALVQSETSNQVLELTGTVRYLLETPLAFTSTGKIATIRYNSGDRVKQGALLAALDTTSVDADLAAARAELVRADAELGRLEKLFEQGWVTRAQLDQAQAAQKSASAQVSARKFATQTSRIFAPSSGIILSREAEPGQVLQAGAPVLIMGEASSGLVLKAPVTDTELSKLSIGMPAQILVKTLGQQPISAQVQDIDGRADPGTGTFSVSFALPNDNRLRSGQIGKVNISVAPDSDDPVLTIAAPAIFDIRTGEALVYVVDPENNKANVRSIRIDKVLDNKISILSGLQPNEQVIITGHEDVRTGDVVAPQNPSRTTNKASTDIQDAPTETLGERADAQSDGAKASAE